MSTSNSTTPVPARKVISAGDLRHVMTTLARVEKRNEAAIKAAEATALASIEKAMTTMWKPQDFPEIADLRREMEDTHRRVAAALDEAQERRGIPKQFRASFDPPRWNPGGWTTAAYGVGATRIEQVRAHYRRFVDAAVRTARLQTQNEAVETRTKLLAGAYSGETAAQAVERIKDLASLPPLPPMREVIQQLFGFDIGEQDQPKLLEGPKDEDDGEDEA